MPQGEYEDYYIPAGLVYDVHNDPPSDRPWFDNYVDWEYANRVLKWPEPDAYDGSRARPAEKRPNLRTTFPDGLQVIFKLANIHLSPADPKYKGGSLHIEGALNDRIVATALFYYDCDNITQGTLTLYHPVNAIELRMVAPDDFSSLERWLGIQNDGPSLQRLGGVLTQEGRLLAFPNVLAHKVEPFKLADDSRPGHQKILAMFLVDPHIRVLSTSVVPPQRKDWWAREVRKVSPLSGLPAEIFDMIIGFVDGFPMSWEDALTTRDILISERNGVEYAFNKEMEDVSLYCLFTLDPLPLRSPTSNITSLQDFYNFL